MDALSEKNNVREVRRILKNLPEELDLTYGDAMQRIQKQNGDDRNLALRALMWVATAYRHLSFMELQQALAIDPDDEAIDPEGYTDNKVLLSRCAGLLVIEATSGTIRFVRE